ncbi:MAG TPA: PIG-L family deacetylase [Nannocystaceae bacterium]|nr:PIG-L family deacetylase [Nannocystaceae bacterium]
MLALAATAALPIALALGLGSWVAVQRRPRALTDPARDVLIVAAHPDDCVIMAGGYALHALAQGRRVTVYYLTCGADRSEPERAATRRAEAIAAWGMAGVPADALVFGGLPEQGPDDTEARTHDDLARARREIERLMRGLSNGAALFVPAATEEHVDHRLLRRLALEALRATGRRDLAVYECAAYNAYISFVQAPHRALREALSAVPGVARWFRGATHPWAGFGSGPPPVELPLSPERARRRRELLRAFASEQGDLLVQLFGASERYRPITDVAQALGEPQPRGYLRMGGHYWSASALILLSAVLALVGIAAALFTAFLVLAFAAGPLAIGLAVALACVVAGTALRPGLTRPTMLVHAAAALGIGSVAALLA